MSPFADCLILTGPTASGKSAVALDLADALGCELVALDSMTVYRGMDIGTAKPTAADRARVPHHLLDELDPWQSADVAWWLGRAAEACADARRRGKRPLLVGGTPFYLKAVLHGLPPAPPADAGVRTRLEAEAAEVGPAEFHRRLAVEDPASAARLHPNDVRRTVRAREVFAVAGRPLSTFAAEPPGPPPPAVALDRPRAELHARIDARVTQMLAAGWPDEVRTLLALSRRPSPEAWQAIGYRELAAHLAGGPTLAETAELIRAATRQFAKRQLTWVRGLGLPTVAAGPGAAGRVRAAWRA
jgi:tRNA dimethylallyltransferase